MANSLIKDGEPLMAKLHLGRAHILSQNSVYLHIKVHIIMFLFSLKFFDIKEIWGQFLRIIVTAPGHLLGRVPTGNIGWASVGLTEVMEVPEDLIEYMNE